MLRVRALTPAVRPSRATASRAGRPIVGSGCSANRLANTRQTFHPIPRPANGYSRRSCLTLGMWIQTVESRDRTALRTDGGALCVRGVMNVRLGRVGMSDRCAESSGSDCGAVRPRPDDFVTLPSKRGASEASPPCPCRRAGPGGRHRGMDAQACSASWPGKLPHRSGLRPNCGGPQPVRNRPAAGASGRLAGKTRSSTKAGDRPSRPISAALNRLS